jgi:hypothetical protein
MFGLDSDADRFAGSIPPGIEGRNPDGSIDYAFYHRRARRLRSAKLRELGGRIAPMLRPVIAVAIIAAAILTLPADRPRQAAPSTDVAGTEWPGASPTVR